MFIIDICHKNPELTRHLEQYIASKYEKNTNVTTYESEERLLERYEKDASAQYPDILIIEADDLRGEGIAAAKWLQNRYPALQIIFLSDDNACVTDIFCVTPSNLLVRPVSGEKLKEALNKAVREILLSDTAFLTASFGKQIFRLRIREIIFCENKRRTVTIYCEKEAMTTYRKLGEIEKELPRYFLRIHQSFLINMNYIVSLDGYCVKLADGNVLPISRLKQQEVRLKYQEFCGYFLQKP